MGHRTLHCRPKEKTTWPIAHTYADTRACALSHTQADRPTHKQPHTHAHMADCSAKSGWRSPPSRRAADLRATCSGFSPGSCSRGHPPSHPTAAATSHRATTGWGLVNASGLPTHLAGACAGSAGMPSALCHLLLARLTRSPRLTRSRKTHLCRWWTRWTRHRPLTSAARTRGPRGLRGPLTNGGNSLRGHPAHP